MLIMMRKNKSTLMKKQSLHWKQGSVMLRIGNWKGRNIKISYTICT